MVIAESERQYRQLHICPHMVSSQEAIADQDKYGLQVLQ